MFIEERHKRILGIIDKEKSVSVKQLTQKLKFSPAIIRSDLNYLSEQGLIIRTHGGATALEKIDDDQTIDVNFQTRRQKNQKEKREIARKAFNYIYADNCIVLDASSTTYELAHLINDSSMRLMVLTNGMNVANLLKDNTRITTILIGGIVRGNSNAIEGSLGASVLQRVNIDSAFLSGHAFNLKDGLTDFNIYEVELKKQMIEYSKSIYALIDYTKLDKSSVASFGSASDVDYFITNDNIDSTISENYKKNNLQII